MHKSVGSIACGLLAAMLGLGGAIVQAGATPPPSSPSNARPLNARRAQTIHGRIVSIDGRYGITIRDVRGVIDIVALHPGTMINPTGLRLAVGMDVTIVGYNAGRSFLADEIDAPYAYGGQVSAQDYNYDPYAYGSGLYDALPFVIAQPDNPPPPPAPSPSPDHNTSRGFERPSPQHPTRSVDTGGGGGGTTTTVHDRVIERPERGAAPAPAPRTEPQRPAPPPDRPTPPPPPPPPQQSQQQPQSPDPPAPAPPPPPPAAPPPPPAERPAPPPPPQERPAASPRQRPPLR